jgi:hypothetical protein
MSVLLMRQSTREEKSAEPRAAFTGTAGFLDAGELNKEAEDDGSAKVTQPKGKGGWPGHPTTCSLLAFEVNGYDSNVQIIRAGHAVRAAEHELFLALRSLTW